MMSRDKWAQHLFWTDFIGTDTMSVVSAALSEDSSSSGPACASTPETREV